MRRFSSSLGLIAIAAALAPSTAAGADRATVYTVQTLDRAAPGAKSRVAGFALDRRRQTLIRGKRTLNLRGRHGGGFRAVAYNPAEKQLYVLGAARCSPLTGARA